MSRVISREALVSKLEKSYPKMNVRVTEDFFCAGDCNTGIWLCGEDDIVDKKGSQIFSYYNDSTKYKFGVINHLVRFLERNGWYPEWYDAGTIMLYPLGG